MEPQRCTACLFCEELGPDFVRCSNADVAHDTGWSEAYLVQGYLELPHFRSEDPPCFWFVQRR